MYGLKSSLSTQRRARPSFEPRRGHHGRFIVPDPPTSGSAEKDNKNPSNGGGVDDDEEEEADQAKEEGGEGGDDNMEFEDVNDQASSIPSGSAGGPQVKRARFD